MSWVVTGLIVAGVGATTSAGAGIYKSVKENEYNDKVSDFNKTQKADAERQARKDALARAIKAKPVNYMPRPTPDAPGLPDMMGADIAGGIGNLASTAGSMASAAGAPATVPIYGPKVPQSFNPHQTRV